MTQANEKDPRTQLGWRRDLRAPLVLGLIILLALQLLVALGVSLSGSGMQPMARQTPLLDFDPEAVTRIRIQGADGQDAVTLARSGEDDWLLPDLGDFPVADFKVEPLLTRLAELKRPLPTATTAEARKRFKVAEAGFERRLILEGDKGPIATLLLGDSPGYRRLFARPADDRAVYDLDLALFDVSDRPDDWIDTGVLRLKQEDIEGIGGDGWTLTKAEDGWRLEGDERQADQAAAGELAMRIANLGYRSVLRTETSPALAPDAPQLVLEVRLADGATREYRISPIQDNEDYVLEASDRPNAFQLSKYDLEGLLDLDADRLAVQPETPPAPETEPVPEAVPTAEAAPAGDERPEPNETPAVSDATPQQVEPAEADEAKAQ